MDYLNSIANKVDPCQNAKTQEFTFWDRSSSVWDGSFCTSGRYWDSEEKSELRALTTAVQNYIV